MDENYRENMNYSFEPADGQPQQPYGQPNAQQPAQPQPKPKKPRTGLKLAALLVAVAIVAGLAGAAVNGAIGGLQARRSAQEQQTMQQTQQEPEALPEQAEAEQSEPSGAYSLEKTPLPSTLKSNDTGKSLTPQQVYKMNVGAVCGIATQVTTNVWGQTTTASCAGSGFVLTEDGYIITNNHVVADANEGSITVKLFSGDEYTAEVVGTDALNDVALLKIEATGLQTVTIGNSDDIEVGDEVEAIGNPLGELTFTMTVGYISALDREINTDGRPINMLQTDASINSGNSGGPLFDMDGNVIGITTAKYSGSTSSGTTIEGIGFAIPINDAMRIVYDLQQYGRVVGRAYLGITLQDMDSAVARQYQLPVGPQVVTVTEGSCAQKAGLQPGDIVVSFEGRQISAYTELVAALRSYRAGDTVTMTVFRAGAQVQLTITLDERPDESEIEKAEQEANESIQGGQEPNIETQPVDPNEDQGGHYFEIPGFGGFGFNFGN